MYTDLLPGALGATCVWALVYLSLLCFAVKTVASSRKESAGTGRGYLAFVAKDYRDDTYYWCVLVFFKDLLSTASAAFFGSGVEQLVFSGTLSLAYT